ncbi:MAG: ABC transporter permease subunit [Dehalococcoidia bacterium]
MWLPVLLLGYAQSAIVSRLTRSTMLDVLPRGLHPHRPRPRACRESGVVVRHAMRNALLPVVTLATIQLGTLLGGAVITESVFGLPEVGRYALDAIRNRDYPVVQAVDCADRDPVRGAEPAGRSRVRLDRPADKVERLMTTATTTVSALDAVRPPRRPALRGVVSFVRRKPLGAVGAALVLFLSLVALAAPLIAPYDPLRSIPAIPSSAEPRLSVGRTRRGVTSSSRVVYGARISLRVGAIAVGFGVSFGMVVGLVTGGYYGGRFDFSFAQRG